MPTGQRLHFLDNLRTFLIFLVVLFHAGVVYDKSAIGTGWWIVVDPGASDLPGLLNLMLDIFIMPTIFFVSGVVAPLSLEKGIGPFLASRFKRLMVPWALAVVTLIPLYKVLYLVARGLPQEHWTTYFHVPAGISGMSWLWFLPVLFIFDGLYAGLSKLHLSPERFSLGAAVTGVFLLCVAWSYGVGAFDWYGWTKTWLVDFQNERVVPYFLVFLLGSLCQKRGVFEASVSKAGERRLKLFITVAATVWIPMNLYAVVLINFFLKPGEYIVSLPVDRLLMFVGFHLSMLGLIYLMVTTFRHWIGHSGRLARSLARLSYGVYIVHVPIVGLIAIALLGSGVPDLLKYLIVALGTWIASNLLVLAYQRSIRR